MITLEPMTQADIDDVWELDKLCFSLPWNRQSFVDELNNHLAHYFILKHENSILAYCGVWIIAGEGHITNVAVHPSHRQKGLGSILVAYLVKMADKLDLSLLTLEVRESNISAQKLYSKFGFKKLGKRKKYYSDNMEDAYIMTKLINTYDVSIP